MLFKYVFFLSARGVPAPSSAGTSSRLRLVVLALLTHSRCQVLVVTQYFCQMETQIVSIRTPEVPTIRYLFIRLLVLQDIYLRSRK